MFSRETVKVLVEGSYDLSGERPRVGSNLLPVMIERFSRERLTSGECAETLVAAA